MKMPRWIVSLLAFGMLASPVSAKTFFPMITQITPCAAAAGQVTECEIYSSHSLHGATAVLVSGQGVSGTIVAETPKPGDKPPEILSDGRLKVRFKVEADAMPGIRDVRILTPRGPSTLGQLVVSRDALVLEKAGDNQTRDTAQLVPLPATVCGGILGREDVDYYRFHVSAGTAWTFHVYCQRLQNKLTPVTYHADPLITLRNASGSVLAANDNFYGADPLIHYNFTAEGDYFLEVRDVRYAGYRYWQYAVEIHDRPLVLHTLPGAVPPGVQARTRLLGFGLPSAAETSLDIPADTPDGVRLVTPRWQDKPLNPVPVLVSRLPMVTEGAGANDTPAQAQVITVPLGVNGVIDKPEDVDCFAFEARKNERFTMHVVARELGSQLDSYLRILDDKGMTLAENDDISDRRAGSDNRNEIFSADSRIENWTAPVDGRYFIEVRDVHQRGGERFPYFLQVRPARPHFTLEIDSDRTTLTPGLTGIIFVRAVRREGFSGDIELRVEGLPSGVTPLCDRIPASSQDGCIFLKTAPDAPRGAADIRVLGRSAGDANAPFAVAARPLQELMVDGGSRYLIPVDTHTLAIVDALDLKLVQVSPETVTLKPGETKTIEVTIERAAGFKEAVTLTAVHGQHVYVFGNCLPPGVTLDANASRTRLPGDQVKGTLVLTAAADAKPCPPQYLPVMANVAINFPLKMIYPAPLRISVAGSP